jgi:hypothetical protein
VTGPGGSRFVRVSLLNHITAVSRAKKIRTTFGKHSSWLLARLFRNWGWQLREFREDFDARPGEFGKHMVAKNAFDRELKSKLRQILEEKNAYPFLIVSGLLPTGKFMPPFRKIQGGCYDIICSGLIHQCDCLHKRAVEGKPPWRVFESDSIMQKNVISDGKDMPLRYRQMTPERRMPHEAGVDNENVCARIVVFACVENSLEDPIWLLPVRTIIQGLSEGSKKFLTERKFEFFGTWSLKTLEASEKRGRKSVLVLGDQEDRDGYLSYDMDRFNLADEKLEEGHRVAMAELNSIIEEKGRDESSGAIPIILRKGDLLISDNYRILHCRKERSLDGAPLNWLRFNRKRHLRVFYGFPEVATP